MKAEKIMLIEVHHKSKTGEPSYKIPCPKKHDAVISDSGCTACRYCRELGDKYVKCVARAYMENDKAPICIPKSEPNYYELKEMGM